MFALEGGLFVPFSPFPALFHDAHPSLTSARSRPTASSLPADASPVRNPRIRSTFTMLSLRPASSRQERLSQGDCHLNWHGKIRPHSKLPGMISLQKRRNNSHRMISLQKNGGGGGAALESYFKFRPRLAELRTGDALENTVRCRLRRHQRFRRNQQRLLHSVLPGHRGMGHAVGKHHPRRPRREFQPDFGGGWWEIVVLFEAI